MEKYDYREAVTNDIADFIKKSNREGVIDLTEYAGRREDLKDDIKENIAFEVSGAASGSYTCDAPTARRNLEDNESILKEAYFMLGIEDHLPHVNGKIVNDEDLVKYIEDPEKADMYIREALATDCVEAALKNVEEELGIDLDDDRTFAKTEVILLREDIPEEMFSDIQDICEKASLDENRLTLPDVTPQEFGEITSNLEYENIDYELEQNALQSNEKMYVVYESVGNFSHETFRSDNFNETQNYLTGREEEARQDAEQKGEEFDSELFYSYFSLEETTTGELAKADKEQAETKQAIRKMNNGDREL